MNFGIKKTQKKLKITTNGKDSTLCQYKGYGDRPVTPEEDAFLTAWCKEKHIIKSERG